MHDPLFAVQQIVDVAARAVSPGINDPTTAVHAAGHLAGILLSFLRAPDAAPVLLDDRDVPRLVPARIGFDDALQVAVTQVRRYGAGDIDVAVRLHELLAQLGVEAREDRDREAVAREAALLAASVGAADYLPSERARFARLQESIAASLAA